MRIMDEIENELFGNEDEMHQWEDRVEDDEMDAGDAGIMFGAESA